MNIKGNWHFTAVSKESVDGPLGKAVSSLFREARSNLTELFFTLWSKHLRGIGGEGGERG
jgi:hypothetical protein